MSRRVTFIVTIDPVKDLRYLSLLIHSLNLQTAQIFDVVFYNQTVHTPDEVLAALPVAPSFPYRFYGVPKDHFLGAYPLWDLYSLHNRLFDDDAVNEYFMSLHAETFLERDYVARSVEVLDRERLDILFGNLTRTELDDGAIAPGLAATTAPAFDRFLAESGVRRAPHWRFPRPPLRWRFVVRRPRKGLERFMRFANFGVAAGLGLNGPVRATRGGYKKRMRYVEDIYFMRREFAERFDWFLRGHEMYFEDIHLCHQEGVCPLEPELRKLTPFPVYLTASRAYHLLHPKYYYQVVDPTFTDGLLARDTDDPALDALKEAIRAYRAGRLDVKGALTFSRQNPQGTGTQNLNYAYHMECIRLTSTADSASAPS